MGVVPARVAWPDSRLILIEARGSVVRLYKDAAFPRVRSVRCPLSEVILYAG